MGSSFAALTVVNPSGNRTQVQIDPIPFAIGRQPGCHLVLRDSRISRSHARIVADGREYYIEDTESSHGLFVNGERVQRHQLASGDSIEFGVPDCYTLVFHYQGEKIGQALRSLPAGGTATLGNLRAIIEVSRVIQSSLSMTEVLSAVVDGALEITGCEQGYLFLKSGAEMELRISRGETAKPVTLDELPPGLRIPLVHIRPGETDKTCILEPGVQSVGLLYLVSPRGPAGISPENRELLQTLALEASAILENARLLEQERAKQHMEEELEIARDIQRGLQPRRLPGSGWFQAAGASTPSSQVGGDYYDVRQIGPTCWSAIVADVSGKGVSSALLASLLQGAFLVAAGEQLNSEAFLCRLNRLLYERTEGEKYATIFYCTVDAAGMLRWTNAGHYEPLLVRGGEIVRTLEATGMPAGLFEDACYSSASVQLNPGDRMVICTDGVLDAQDPEGARFGTKRLRELVRAGANLSPAGLLNRIVESTESFTGKAEPGDDITALVLEYRP